MILLYQKSMSDEPQSELGPSRGRLRSEDRSGRSSNVFQDEYHLPKELTDTPQTTLEESWGEQGNARKKLIIIGSLLSLLLLGVGGIITMGLLHEPALVTQVNTATTNKEIPPLPPLTEAFMERTAPEEFSKAVETTLKGFMNASTHKERCQFILNGEGKISKLEEFYAREQAAFLPKGFGRVEVSIPAAFDGRSMVLALAVEKSGKRAWNYSLFPEGDSMKINWETSVSYGEMNWRSFLAEKPSKPTQMRVYLSQIPVVQMTQFSPDHYDAYTVSAYGVPGTVILPVPKGTPKANTLLKYVSPSAQKHPINLSLSWKIRENAQKKSGQSLHLENVIHNLWTAPTP